MLPNAPPHKFISLIILCGEICVKKTPIQNNPYNRTTTASHKNSMAIDHAVFIPAYIKSYSLYKPYTKPLIPEFYHTFQPASPKPLRSRFHAMH